MERPIRVPVPVPVPVSIPKPFTVPVHVPVQVVIDKAYPITIKVPVDRPYPITIPKPYSITVKKAFPIPAKKPVKVDKPFPGYLISKEERRINDAIHESSKSTPEVVEVLTKLKDKLKQEKTKPSFLSEFLRHLGLKDEPFEKEWSLI